MELPNADHRSLCRGRPCNGQCRCLETRGRGVLDRSHVRRTYPPSRPPRWCAERRSRPWHANLDDALPFLVNAGIQNAGQTCSASSRILVHHTRYDEVVAAMSERYKALMVGPALADLNLGPLISQRQKSIVTGFLKQGEDLQIAATGQISPDAPSSGAYVAPHLLLCPDPNHPLAQQEIFGPVQVIIPFKDEADAIKIANGTD